MSIISALRTFLLTNGAISTRVGASRIYDTQLPQEPTLPAISLQIIDNIPITSHSGQRDARRPIVQLSHFAQTPKEARDMEAETDAVLAGYRGSLGSYSGVTILKIDARDDFEPELSWGIQISEFQVWHN